MKEYDLIMFDVGGVILYHKESRHYKYISRELGLPIEEFSKIGFSFARQLERRKITMREVEMEIRRKFEIRNPSKVRGIWTRAFRKSVRKDEKMLDLVKMLHRMKYRIAISTNTNISDYRILYGKNGILRSLREYRIFASCFMVAAKPDPRYYKYVLKSMKAVPERTLFIDDRKENLEPARNLKITTILFKNYEQLVKDLSELGFNLS